MPGLEFDEGAVVGDVGDASVELRRRPDTWPRCPATDRSSSCFMPSEMRCVSWLILMILHLHLLADIEHLGRVIDAPPRDVGDVQQAVDAAEVDERAVVGDVLHDAVDDLAFFEVLHQLLTLFGAGLFENGAARDDDVAAAAIHLQDLERLRRVHQRGDVADRADVDLASAAGRPRRRRGRR